MHWKLELYECDERKHLRDVSRECDVRSFIKIFERGNLLVSIHKAYVAWTLRRTTSNSRNTRKWSYEVSVSGNLDQYHLPILCRNESRGWVSSASSTPPLNPDSQSPVQASRHQIPITDILFTHRASKSRFCGSSSSPGPPIPIALLLFTHCASKSRFPVSSSRTEHLNPDSQSPIQAPRL